MQPSAPSRWGWWQGLVAGQSLAGTCCAFIQWLPAIASIWAETLLSIGSFPTIYHLCPQTEQDHTEQETKSIYLGFVWVTRCMDFLRTCTHARLFHVCVQTFWLFWLLLELHCATVLCWNFSTLSDLWSSLQKWLIRVLELGWWSRKQIFPFSQCHVFSLMLAVRKQWYTKVGLVSL